MKKTRFTIPLALLLILAFAVSALSAEFWGSKNSDKYHYPICQWAQKIKPDNLVRFSSPEEAVRAGYVPCKVCRPPLPSSSGSGSNSPNRAEQSSSQASSLPDVYFCTRVIDGDTIAVEVNGSLEKVRLIGVDTPETVHPNKPVEYFGKEASNFTRNMVEGKLR